MWRSKKGQSLVEMALVLPVLIFILMGTMEGGRIFAGYLELQNAARDGARYAAVYTDKTDTEVKTRATANFVLLKEDQAGFNFTLNRSGDSVTVSMTYPMEIITPVISNIIGNSVTLNSSMVMRSEAQ